jgi:hypothetical protein
MPDGNLYLPWHLGWPARLIPYQFASAYLFLAVVLSALSLSRPALTARGGGN